MASRSDAGMRRMAAQMHALAAVRREIKSRDSASNCKYLREFNDAYQRYDRTLSPEELNRRLSDADTLLVGDYHALPASQRFAAGVVELLAHERPVVLGVEAILSRSQQILDAWWRREISEQSLRERLQFDREWGYDWQPFYELLTAARENADAIYGLDCMPRDDLRRIRSRDRHAAAKISEIRKQHANARIVVLFGESHMAEQHLPRELQKLLPQESVLTVLQNLDSIYYQAVQEHAAAVELDENTVCVFNASPLEKYESYRLCLERWNSAPDESPDFTPAIHNLIFSLARCLGFRLDSPRNGTQPKFLADSLPEIVADADTSTLESQLAIRLEENGCVYVPMTNTFYIREFQMAQAAREATRFLHFACRGMVNGNTHSQAVEDALAHFGSRLLCPSVGGEQQISNLGESLYQAYVEARIGKPALRKMFLARFDDCEQTVKISLMLADAIHSIAVSDPL